MENPFLGWSTMTSISWGELKITWFKVKNIPWVSQLVLTPQLLFIYYKNNFLGISSRKNRWLLKPKLENQFVQVQTRLTQIRAKHEFRGNNGGNTTLNSYWIFLTRALVSIDWLASFRWRHCTHFLWTDWCGELLRKLNVADWASWSSQKTLSSKFSSIRHWEYFQMSNSETTIIASV